MGAPVQNHHGHAQGNANPEASREVAEFVAFLGVRRDGDRLQGHAANWAVSRPRLTHLRVHRARVLHTGHVSLLHLRRRRGLNV